MGVRKKGRRKLNYNGRLFIWYFKEEEWYLVENEEGLFAYEPLLHIISEDKKFIVTYRINQIKSECPYITSKGSEFSGTNNSLGCRQRLRTPNWNYEFITPKIVREIIEWCLNPKENLVFVDYFGREIKTT